MREMTPVEAALYRTARQRRIGYEAEFAECHPDDTQRRSRLIGKIRDETHNINSMLESLKD